MKNTAIGILLIATLAFARLYFQQSSKTNEAENTAGGLQQKVVELEASLEQQKTQTASLRGQLENTRDVAASHAGEVAQLKQSLTQIQQATTNHAADSSTNARAANPMADLLKNPEMREQIKNGQKAVLGPMVEKNFAGFIAAAQLAPDQAANLKNLLTQKMLLDADLGTSILTGDPDAATRADMLAQNKTDKAAIDAQIKQSLGDDTYTQFQAYEKTVPERTAVSSFNDQLAGGGTGLSADQQQQLIQLMSQDRLNFKFTTDYSDQSKFDGDMTTYFSDDKLNQFQQELGQLNDLYRSHATSVLSSDQLTAFQKFLTGQQNMQAAGLKMAAKMFGPGK